MTILRGIAVFLVCLLAGMTPWWVRLAMADTQVFPFPPLRVPRTMGAMPD